MQRLYRFREWLKTKRGCGVSHWISRMWEWSSMQELRANIGGQPFDFAAGAAVQAVGETRASATAAAMGGAQKVKSLSIRPFYG